MGDVEAALMEAFLEDCDSEDDAVLEAPGRRHCSIASLIDPIPAVPESSSSREPSSDSHSPSQDDTVLEPLAKRHRSIASQIDSHPAATEPTPSSEPSSGSLCALPVELVLEVLAGVSALDLAAIAQTCKFLHDASKTNDLWRALTNTRWGDELEVNGGLHDQSSWKAFYMERDAEEVNTVKERAPASLQTFYLQMTTAKRHLLVPRHRKLPTLSNTALLGSISRWRGSRGLLKCPCPTLGSKHVGCARPGPYAALRGGLFMCEGCGWAHLCGDNCGERLVDQESQFLVCPVSGRCFDRMLAEWEEEGKEVQEVEAGCDFGVAGHWGRAYSNGYNCSNEEELRYNCGVAM